MIDVQNLTKYYGQEMAVNDISFTVEKGQVVGFLGPNGAGKSTTVRILTCFLAPTQGTAIINGYDIFENSVEIRRQIGYLPENAPLYSDMTVFDFLKFCVDIRKDGARRSGRVGEVIDICGIKDVLHKDIAELSKGFRQRVGLAQAMIHDPEILILDEPTVGLDPNQIVEIRKLIKDLGREKTVILCSHILPEVEATCNRVLIINRGEIVADGTSEKLRASFEGKGKVILQVKDCPPDRIENLINIPGIENVGTISHPEHGISMTTLDTMKGSDPRESIFKYCVNNNLVLLEMIREKTSLENVFHQLTSREEV
jgi:gliding motility-associated transport system ATP-binding protein